MNEKVVSTIFINFTTHEVEIFKITSFDFNERREDEW